MKIHLNQIPPHGLHLEGNEEAEILDLNKIDTRAISPISYTLDAGVSGSSFFVTGSLAVEMEAACVSCSKKFPWTARVDKFAMQTEIAGVEVVDLTPYIREDILLNLPPYPRCDRDGGRVCKGAPSQQQEEPLSPVSKAWEVLDKLTVEKKK